MYTSTDTNEVLRLLEQYHVTYIFVGSKEKEKIRRCIERIAAAVHRRYRLPGYCVRYVYSSGAGYIKNKNRRKEPPGAASFLLFFI